MAITTYSELQTAIANWLDNDDLTSRIPEFIALAEASMIRQITHWRMEKRATANTTAGDRTLPLPSDYRKMRNLKLNTTTTRTLEFMSPSVLYNYSVSSGVPRFYTVQGDQLALEPVPDSTYEVEMNYYAFTVLSDSAPTNWLLTYFPDAYLFGALVQGLAFNVDDNRIPLFQAAFDKALLEIKKDDKEARWNGGPLISRVQM